MSALTAARRPQSREVALAGQAARSLRCVQARRLSGGAQPLWRVLERACRFAEHHEIDEVTLCRCTAEAERQLDIDLAQPSGATDRRLGV